MQPALSRRRYSGTYFKMRIAYIAPYQGPELVKRRPCLKNLSLAARVKIQLVAELLQRGSHEVEIISPGAVEPRTEPGAGRFTAYPAFAEPERFHAGIPIHYVSAISVKHVTGFWESIQTRRCLSARHKARPFDAVVIYNMGRGQIGSARYALRTLGLPVVLEYEDDSFVNVHGHAQQGLIGRYHRAECQKMLREVSGGTGVSPYLVSQLPSDVPRLLLRGVVSNEIVAVSQGTTEPKKNWVVFSGTHEGTQGLEQMIRAWRVAGLDDWTLHVAGHGPLTATLETMAAGARNIVFHGLLNRQENARLICASKIGMNPQDLTTRPGNVFAFKIIEYLAAGTHVLTTPRGVLEPELEAGVSYIPDNTPETIAAALKQIVQERRYERTAVQAALRAYGPDAICRSLNALVTEAAARRRSERRAPEAGMYTPSVQ